MRFPARLWNRGQRYHFVNFHSQKLFSTLSLTLLPMFTPTWPKYHSVCCSYSLFGWPPTWARPSSVCSAPFHQGGYKLGQSKTQSAASLLIQLASDHQHGCLSWHPLHLRAVVPEPYVAVAKTSLLRKEFHLISWRLSISVFLTFSPPSLVS